jgi:hypothetical protein
MKRKSLIRKPNLLTRWQAGSREPARCISCNGGFMPGLEKGGIYCIVAPKEAEKVAKARQSCNNGAREPDDYGNSR